MYTGMGDKGYRAVLYKEDGGDKAACEDVWESNRSQM
jgi:hypothetical protein